MANKIVKLKDGDNYLYPYANFMAIDTSNLIASGINTTNDTPYTATQDCFVINTTARTTWNIDGVSLSLGANGKWYFPLKKGQAFKTESSNATSINVYGIKY